MKREIITITDNGKVTVPSEIKMSIVEIADLFGICYQTVKLHIRAIEKSGTADGDYSQSCVCVGSKAYPNYYGLEMVVAVAFRVQSARTDVFRQWLKRRVISSNANRTIVLQMNNLQMLN